MTAPTFIAESETVWNTTTTPKTSGSLSVQTGDVLLDCIADANFTTTEDYTTTNSGTAQTWTEHRPSGLSNNADCSVQIHRAVSTVTASMTVTSTRTVGGADQWGKNVLQYRGSAGVGQAPGSASGQSVSITVAQDSSIVVIVADWGATSWGASTRPWISTGGLPTPVEQSYVQTAGQMTIGVCRWEGVSAGTYTVGLTGLAGTGFCIQAVEVLGTASGSGVTVTGVTATSTATALAPSASAGASATAPVATSTALALPPAVSTAGGVTVTAPLATSTATALAPQAGAGCTITSGLMTAAATVYSPSLQLGMSLTAPRALSTAAANAPSLSIGSTAAAPLSTATAQAYAPQFGGPVSLVAPAATAAAQAFAPAVAAGSANVTIATPCATATATALSPFVGVPGMAGTFTPPNILQGSDDPFFGRYLIPVGLSVVKRNGVFTTVPIPWLGEIHDLTEGVDYFLGGRTYVVDDAVGAALFSAGYEVVDNGGYGEPAFGSQGFGV